MFVPCCLVGLVVFVNVILTVGHVVESGEEKSCFGAADRQLVNQRLGTKTPYRFISPTDGESFSEPYEGCHAQRIWSLVRHGTRNPNRKTIRHFTTQLQDIRRRIVAAQTELGENHTTLCDKELDNFRHWNQNIDEDEEKYLRSEGEDELEKLAIRLQRRFPDLLSREFSKEAYRFKFTKTQRTQKSFQSFAAGLFGHDKVADVSHPAPLKRDRILRFYKLCDRWSLEVDANPETLREQQTFRKSKHVREAIARISKKAGNVELTFDDVQLIYTTCSFETAWNKTLDSPWCTLLDAESARVMEFDEDLDYYYVDGYGNRLTYEMACTALGDMVQRLDPSSTKPPATFYFTHSGTMLKMLSHLGLYRDEAHLTHASYDTPEADRRAWRVSRIDAFASNLVFVMYNCTTGPHIVVHHQERPVRIPGCPVDSDLCSLALFRSVFRQSIDNCNFDEMCAVPEKKKKHNKKHDVEHILDEL